MKSANIASLLLILAVSIFPVEAQSGNGFEITESVFASSSSNTVAAVNFSVDGIVGQHLSGDDLSGSQFSLTSGFWTFTSLVPTAAGVSVDGRVLQSVGYGVSGATISLRGLDGQAYYARSNQFGYFRISDVPAGQTYIVSVSKKGMVFEPRSISILDNVGDLIITARP